MKRGYNIGSSEREKNELRIQLRKNVSYRENFNFKKENVLETYFTSA